MTTTSNTYKIKNINTYDNLGRLQSESENNVTKTYSYDRNNRLLTETKDSGDTLATVTYAYDANGNQLSKVGGTLSSSIGNPVVVGLSVLGQSEDSGLIAEINTYNAFNQLTQVQTARHSVSYAYKADGLRTSKTSNGQTTSFVWDGSNIAAENRGGDYQTYTRGIGLIRNGAGEYYLFDAHGDVVQMAGSSGVVREYRYDAFGNEVEPDENDTNPFRYCGEYWDGETGTVYLRNRYYSPVNGRFSTEDPILSGLNWYSYCDNNPIMFIDPLGLLTEIIVYNGEGSAWYGHAEISVNGVLYSYGMYLDRKSVIKGDGILVKAETSRYLPEINETIGFTAYKINLTSDEESKIVQFYENLIKTAESREPKTKSDYLKELYQLSGDRATYYVYKQNCVTVLADAIYSAMNNAHDRLYYYSMVDGMQHYIIGQGVFYPHFLNSALDKAYKEGINNIITDKKIYKPSDYPSSR